MTHDDAEPGLDATALAALVRSGEASPKQLVEAAIARIERLNPRLNAVVTPMYEAALAAAVDARRDAPFGGVPFLVKDLAAPCKGVRMTNGSRWLADYVPDQDDLLIRRYRQAGLIIVGRTNTPEFGLLPTTESTFLGRCNNPWDDRCSTGGSSGGAAAAVASGMVTMAHASDGGGSIRIPASCCGLFGLKPTRGRISAAPDLGDVMSGLVNAHAVTLSVRDSAALLDAVAGPAPGDPYFAAPPSRPFAAEVGAKVGRLKIAFAAAAPDGTALHPDSVAAVEDAARLCAELGHEVDQAAPEIDAAKFIKAFNTVWRAGLAWQIEGWARRTGRGPAADLVEPATWAFYERGRQMRAAAYLGAVQTLQRTARDLARFLERYDLWLTPTLAAPPPPLGYFDYTPDNPLQRLERVAAYIPFTPLANACGLPAMSVPLYWTADGLPIGSHFLAGFGEEAVLFRLAAQLEAARPWAPRRPPIAA